MTAANLAVILAKKIGDDAAQFAALVTAAQPRVVAVEVGR